MRSLKSKDRVRTEWARHFVVTHVDNPEVSLIAGEFAGNLGGGVLVLDLRMLMRMRREGRPPLEIHFWARPWIEGLHAAATVDFLRELVGGVDEDVAPHVLATRRHGDGGGAEPSLKSHDRDHSSFRVAVEPEEDAIGRK